MLGNKQWWEADIIQGEMDEPCLVCGTRLMQFTRATGRKTCMGCGAFRDVDTSGVSTEGAAWAEETRA